MRRSFLLVPIVLCGSILLMLFGAAAQDKTPPRLEDRVSNLEALVASLTSRVETLEHRASEAPRNVVPPARAAWRQLRKGMQPADVRRLLGRTGADNAHAVGHSRLGVWHAWRSRVRQGRTCREMAGTAMTTCTLAGPVATAIREFRRHIRRNLSAQQIEKILDRELAAVGTSGVKRSPRRSGRPARRNGTRR